MKSIHAPRIRGRLHLQWGKNGKLELLELHACVAFKRRKWHAGSRSPPVLSGSQHSEGVGTRGNILGKVFEFLFSIKATKDHYRVTREMQLLAFVHSPIDDRR